MMNWYRRIVPAVLCGLIGISCGCQKAEPTGEPKQTSETHPASATNGESFTSVSAPEKTEPKTTDEISLEIATWDEVKEQVAAHTGKVVVLDLWATSCQPCIREFPNLVALQKKYPKRVVCLSVNSDYFGTKSKPPEYFFERVKEFLTQQQATFDNFLCSVPSDELYVQLNLASIPAVMVFGTDGELVNRFDNDEQKYGDEFTYQDHVIPLIEKLLQESSTDTQGEQ